MSADRWVTTRRSLFALLVLASWPARAGAQAPVCELSRVGLADDWFIFPEKGQTVGADLLIFGQGAITVVESRGSSKYTPDRSMAGFVLKRDGSRVPVEQPVKGSFLIAARTLALHPDTALVVFRAARSAILADSEDDSVHLWSGRFTRRGWGQVRRVSSFGSAARMGREATGDMVRHDGEILMAFRDSVNEYLHNVVTMAHVHGDALSVEHVNLNQVLLGVAYTTIGVHEGVLHLAISALIPENRSDESVPADIWTSKRTPAGWSPIERAVDGLYANMLTEPRFLSTADGMVLAWQERIDGRHLLQWKLMSDGQKTVVHTKDVTGSPVQGQAPFHHLMTAPVNDSTAEVLQLTGRGHRVLATVPILRNYAPMLAGSAARPMLLSVAPTSVPGSTAELRAFELRCAAANLRP